MALSLFGAGTLLAQTPPAQAPLCSATDFKKSQLITVSSDGAAATVTPDVACVAKGGKVSWTANDGDSWSTDFKDDASSPFPAGKAHHEGRSGKTSGGKVKFCSKTGVSYTDAAGGCSYKFKATHKKGGQAFYKDPIVIVQPGT